VSIPAEVRREVEERSGGRCEAMRVCMGAAAEHMHHKRLQSQSGGDTPDNLVHLCFACHRWVHRNPVEAWRKGLYYSPKLEAFPPEPEPEVELCLY
jgi:hypothetical protein